MMNHIAAGPCLRRFAAVWVMGCVLLSAAAQAQTDPLTTLISEHVNPVQIDGTLTSTTPPSALEDGVAAFYALRQYRPAWRDPAHLQALIEALQRLSRDGLNPADYQLTALEQAAQIKAESDAQRADIDLLATRSCLLALLHLYQGKLDPTKLHPRWNFEPREFDRDTLLLAVSGALDRGETAELFQRARPINPIYTELLNSLATLWQVAVQGGWPQLETGPKLELGMTDPQVLLLRQRLVIGGYLLPTLADSELFDAELQQAVKQFQQEQYLADDGAVGRATRQALNVAVGARIDQLRVNLERARWLLPRISGDFVMVDVAGYKVRYIRDGKSVWSSRVQVGTAARGTPIFKAEISNIVFNPPWTIPPTILREDVLPKIRKSASYLKRNHIRVLNAQGEEIVASQVNWNHPGNVVLRQDAGPASALGRVKINFPNPYSIYLHETPHAELFAAGARPFSSGCIRVEHPFELAEILLNDPVLWSRAEIDRVVAEGETVTVPILQAVPVLMLYWTVDIHAPGRIAYKPDIYGLDQPTLSALDQAPTLIAVESVAH